MNKLLKTLENLELLRDFIKENGKILTKEEENTILDLLSTLLLDTKEEVSISDKKILLAEAIKDIPEVACYSEGETKCPYAILCGADFSNNNEEIMVLCKLINMMAYSYNGEETTLKACPIKKIGGKIQKIIN